MGPNIWVTSKTTDRRERVAKDETYTAPSMIEKMVGHIPNVEKQVIWDPFPGPTTNPHTMINVLAQSGLQTRRYDGDVDAFTVTPPKDATVIVANPPYSRKTEALRYIVDTGIPAVVLLPIWYMQSRTFLGIFSKDMEQNPTGWALSTPDYTDCFVMPSGAPCRKPPFPMGILLIGVPPPPNPWYH